jgi:glutamate dehydrogenase
MLGSVPHKRLALIEALVRKAPIARAARSAARRALLRGFLRTYFRGVSEHDLGAHDPASLSALALAHFELGARRAPGEALVATFDVAPGAASQTASASYVAVVTDDMPFLVDSVGLVFRNAGCAVGMLVHPVVEAARDARGRLRALHALAADAERPGCVRESWQLYEIERRADAAELAALGTAVRAALGDVRSAVQDWKAMRDRALEVAAELGRRGPRRAPAAELDDSRNLLDWMADANFVFLGYRHYRLQRGRSADLLVPDARSGLGILRATTGLAHLEPQRLEGALRRTARDATPIVITKANAVSSVHRATYLDYVGVKQFDARGRPCAEHRFLGLWTSTAYYTSPRQIPLLRGKIDRVVAHFGLDPGSHDAKAVLSVLESWPRDELFQSRVGELVGFVRNVVNLYERRSTLLLARRDPFGRFWSCMIYVPRDRYSTDVRGRIEKILQDGCGGSRVESQVQLSDASHARLHVVVRGDAAAPAHIDVARLERAIADAATTWSDRLRAATLARTQAAPRGASATSSIRSVARHAQAFPLAYQEEVLPAAALADIEALEALRSDPLGLRLCLHRAPGAASSRLNLRIVKLGEAMAVSDLLPIMENFGLRMHSERPYALQLDTGGRASVQDFGFELRSGAPVALGAVAARFTTAVLAAWRGEIENDGFNRLLLATSLQAREIVLLRACCRYLLQTGLPFSQAYMEQMLARNAAFAADLFGLFSARFDPAVHAGRERRAQALERRLRARLEGVAAADEDRILRAFLELIMAMLRTSFYRQDSPPDAPLAFKLDPRAIAGLPLPRPQFEIFVYSPRVEGVHLRMGRVARGGIRWSDRREDFRTEILGLMKAQNVKNTLIVPVGAKGGFVPRRLPTDGGREAIQREGIAAYELFIGALLDLTDNIVRGRVVPPAGVVRRDDDDPYLVVAADKGTASFSDIANAISVRRGFWLGDAFASGGSAGYDHKKMGITARGAWECVKRHFRELGTDIQAEDFTVVGIGDMSGDVFGNGMLLSPHIRLVGAFNHAHLFLDPEPDAARSLRERARLFALPRSGWNDYDRKAISRGGGVFERSAKSVPLSPECQKLLGIATPAAAPAEIIRALLRLRVDLLWNGGIGTYVKAGSESHAEAGDRSNDAVRVDGRELRARVVGEGGNLGLTQRGRVEYALAGGRLNTDFIDNSAGVNTSDVEVNLKILTAAEERAGRLRRRSRDTLLAAATDEVAALVLRNNYLQSQALSTLEQNAVARFPEFAHLIRDLERSGDLNRTVEFLPDDAGLEERRKQGRGLTRPELAVVFAYSKIALNVQLLASDVPEDPYLSRELERYFPARIRQRFARGVARHALRREIIATSTTNSLVNRMGPTFTRRAQEETGATPAQIARAYSIAREAFDMRARWAEIEALDNRLPASLQYAMHFETARLLRHASYWLLRHRRERLAVLQAVRDFSAGIAKFRNLLPGVLAGGDLARHRQLLAAHRAAGVPERLAAFIAATPALEATLDVIELARTHGTTIAAAATAWFDTGARIGLDWLGQQIDALPVDGTWQAIARVGLREGARDSQRAIAERILARHAAQRGSAHSLADSIDGWMADAGAPLAGWQRTLGEMRAASAADFATLSVGVDAVRRLCS